MRRRSFLETSAKYAAGIAAACAGNGFPGSNTYAAGKKQPNIVLIVADDTGWNDVGYHGSEIKTPNMDRLAREGVELDRFYVYPTCSPTRAALMTGRPPSRVGVMGPLQIKGDRGLPKDTVTVAETLRRNGYDTAISGKWHLGMKREFGPNNYGFNHSYGYVGPWIDSYSHLTTDFTNTMAGVRQWHRNGELIDEVGHVTDLVTDEAIDFITTKRDKSKPFFLYVPHAAPHVPCQEPNEWTSPYDDSIENTSRKYFAAAMTHMDDAIGKLTGTLRSEGLEEDTIVIFFSDNGGQKGGEYERWLMAPSEQYMSYGATDVLGDNRPLNSWKGQVYEGGIRVPAFVSWPGTLKAGKVTEPMYVCDIYPTVAALAGGKAPQAANVEGKDVWAEINGGKSSEERTFFYWTNWSQALIKGQWKLINRGRTLDDGKKELYNLEKDPYEKTDLAVEKPEIVSEMLEELIRQHEFDKK